MAHVMDAGSVLPIPGEGQDFSNFGAANSDGENIVTCVTGLRYRPAGAWDLGVSFQAPFSKREGTGVIDYRWTADVLCRFNARPPLGQDSGSLSSSWVYSSCALWGMGPQPHRAGASSCCGPLVWVLLRGIFRNGRLPLALGAEDFPQLHGPLWPRGDRSGHGVAFALVWPG